MLCAFAARDASSSRRRASAASRSTRRRRRALLANETKRPWPEKSCIHDLLFAAARKHPTAAALKYDLALAKTTYRALGSAIAVLAARLAALGCLGPDAPVALLLERDPSLVVGVYGALAAGGCYVPLEPDYPLERIKTVVEDAGCSVVVTQQRLVDGPLKALLGEGSVELPAVVQAVVPLKFGADDAGGLDVFGGGDRDDCGAGARAPTTTPGHLVYIFYTSGTTGKPKGVAVEHRGLTLIGDHPGVKAKVRVAISCGEALPAATAKLFQAFDGARSSTTSDPAEADMAYYEMDRATALAMARPPPIGRPMDNVTAYLLDERLRPVPAGAPGHLHFGAPHAC
ncbi:hypothetical protein JL720_15970 [Aureococcus anophagefferens]|nr:hypothetical protein JL720_15970 [Aureococcus anophagefferens]